MDVICRILRPNHIEAIEHKWLIDNMIFFYQLIAIETNTF